MRRSIAGLTLLVLAACNNDDGGPAPRTPGPVARDDDPPLTHSFTMPAEASPLAKGDLGTIPVELADALMAEGKLPSIAHRITSKCAEARALEPGSTHAIRFVLADGALGKVEAEPRGASARCLEDALRDEARALGSLPAGGALLRIELHRKTP